MDKSSVKYAVLFTASGYLVWSLLAALLFGLSLGRCLLYLALLILGIALPGIAVFKLLGIKATPLESLIYSAAFGTVCLVILYVILNGLDLLFYHSLEGVIVLGVLSGIVLFIKRKQPMSRKKDSGELNTALILSAVSCAVTVLCFSAALVNPGLAGIRAYENDPIFASSVNAAASRGWPLICLQVAGIRMTYHPVFYMIFGLLENASGLSSFELLTKASLPVVTPFLVSCFYLLFTRCSDSKKARIAASVFGLMFPCGYALFYYTYEDLLGYPLALGYFALALVFFSDYQKEKRIGSCALSSLFVVMTLTAKGPLGAVVLFGIGIVMIVDFIKKPTWNAVICAFIYLIPSISIYLLLYGNSTAGDMMTLSLGYTAIRTKLGLIIYQAIPTIFGRIICMIIYSLTFVPVPTAAHIISLRDLIKKQGSRDISIFSIATIVLGMVFISIFKQTGSSEWYFLFCLVPVSSMVVCERIFSLLSENRKTVPYILLALLTAGSLIWSGPFAFRGLRDSVTYSRFTDHDSKFVEETVRLIQNDTRKRAVTPDEYEALLWLKENTPINAVIADCRYLHDPFYAGGSAFSERPFYIQGNNYITISENLRIERDGNLRYLYILEEDGFMSLLMQKGVKYVLIDEFYNPGYYPDNPNADLVFENDGMRIYELHP